MTKKEKTYGLVLDLGGAAGWHSIPVLGLSFHPDIPTPVGGGRPGATEPSYAQAKEWSADPGMPVRMVEIGVDEVPELREAVAEARKEEQTGEDNPAKAE